MRRSIAFWITREDLLSNQPSAIHAMEATMKIANPETVIRACTFAATIAAATTVVQAAIVLSIANSSMLVPKQRVARPARAALFSSVLT